jgi:hypothetical protein
MIEWYRAHMETIIVYGLVIVLIGIATALYYREKKKNKNG